MQSVKFSHQLKQASALLFFVGILLVGFWGVTNANSILQYKASGYAWGSISDNGNNEPETGIGYISFGCENDDSCDTTATTNFPTGYGVRINTDPDSPDEGKFLQYAWSSNYGWISFYHNDVSACGGEGGLEIIGDVQQAISNEGWNQELSGYARVLNYDMNEWNGCISFSGAAADGSEYGVKIVNIGDNKFKLGGMAWGGNVVGWIDFDCPYCKVVFDAVPSGEEECAEADDPEECLDPEDLENGLALYVGGENDAPFQIIGNSTYTAPITDPDQSKVVTLIPQAFDQSVDTCVATNSSSMGANVSGWNGPLASLNPLNPDILSNEFNATISNYSVGEIITFTINCMTVLDDTPVSAQAFVTLQYPTSSVSIDANPNPIDTELDPSGSTDLSWTFSNVEDGSCEVNGVVDFTPADGTDAITAMTSAFATSIGFNSWSPDAPGTDDLFGIVNFPVGFTITCEDFAGQNISDSVYITTTELGCTESMEAAGWCSNAVNPIFEEF
jgi:hypothetical protein